MSEELKVKSEETEICPHTNKPYNCSSCEGATEKKKFNEGSYHCHMSQSIASPLKNWKKADWEEATSYITNDGKKMSADELKDLFLSELSQGHKVVPVGECDNFCYKIGCMGHEEK